MTIQTMPTNAAPGSTSIKVDRAAYFARLLELRQDLNPDLSAEVAGWLAEVRQRALAEVRSHAIPTTRDEEWRFTDLAPLLAVEFQTSQGQAAAVEPEMIQHLLLPEASQTRLVFVNGRYAPWLSAVASLPQGVWVGSLSDADLLAALHSDLPAYLGQQQALEQTFTALNTASLSDAAVVWLPRNTVLETPVHLLFLSTATDTPLLAQPRCLVVAAPNSAVTLVEDYATVGSGVCFTNAVTEIWLAENAQVSHTRLQRDRPTAFHIGKTAVSQEKTSRYTCNAINLGGAIARHNLEIFQTGEQTETILNGLTLASGQQLSDTHSLIAYSKPYGMSRQLQKCIVGDQAHTVFNGKVRVPQAAQLTDAGQLNRNLLLSPRGRVDTKPQLEIVADNVKCTHGATVSQLAADEVFYLQSRGIDAASAQALLIYAFAAEVIEKIPLPSLKQSLSQVVENLAQ
ncbi:MAG: Fe-S cluster assembly protein SufD [Synechococcales bacterium]|nr:Fe-S cluster assembly protein SufD [Synechococcales bacterium]